MNSSDKEGRAAALRAVLDMIDSDEFVLDSKEDREAALEHVVDVNSLTCWGGTFRNRRRIPYPMWKLSSQFAQLTNQLIDGVQETTPKIAIIWQSGTSVIKPEYLNKHLNYEIALETDNTSQASRARSEVKSKQKSAPKACRYAPGPVRALSIAANPLQGHTRK